MRRPVLACLLVAAHAVSAEPGLGGLRRELRQHRGKGDKAVLSVSNADKGGDKSGKGHKSDKGGKSGKVGKASEASSKGHKASEGKGGKGHKGGGGAHGKSGKGGHTVTGADVEAELVGELVPSDGTKSGQLLEWALDETAQVENELLQEAQGSAEAENLAEAEEDELRDLSSGSTENHVTSHNHTHDRNQEKIALELAHEEAAAKHNTTHNHTKDRAEVKEEFYHESDGHVHDRFQNVADVADANATGHTTVHQHSFDRNPDKNHTTATATVLEADNKCSITLPNGAQIYAPCHDDESENTHVVTSAEVETAEEIAEDEKITSWFNDHGVKPVATVHAKPVEHARPASEADPTTLVVDVHPDAIPEGLEAHVVHATSSGKEKTNYVKAEPLVDGKHAVHGTPVEGTTGTHVTATAHAAPVKSSASTQQQEEQEQRGGSSGSGTALIVAGCVLLGAAAGYAGRTYQKNGELDCHKKDDDSYVSSASESNLALGVRSVKPYMDEVGLDDDEMEFA